MVLVVILLHKPYGSKNMNYKTILIVSGVVVAVGVAAVRVAPYVANSRESPRAVLPGSSVEIKSIILESNIPEYDTVALRNNIDTLRYPVVKSVKSALNQLPSSQRPSQADVDGVSTAFADYILLYRAGTREEFVLHYQQHGFGVPKSLEETHKNADEAWTGSAVWAKHKPLQLETVKVMARFINGRPINSSNPTVSKRMRPLRTGGHLVIDGPQQYSVYEIQMDTIVPTIDGKKELQLKLVLGMINDGIEGEWSVLETGFEGLQPGEFVYSPYP